MGNVEADAGGWVNTVRCHLGPEASDLFLNGIEADEGPSRFFLGGGHDLHGLSDDVAAYSVVESSANEEVFTHLHGAIDIDGRVPYAEAKSFHFGRIGCSDIDPEFVGLRGLFIRERVAAKVDGGVANDAGDFAFVTEDTQAAATCSGNVGASDTIEAEEAVFLNMFDDEPNLVGVGLKH